MAEESFKERARQEMIKAAKQYKDIYVETYRTKCVDENRLQLLKIKGWRRFNLFLNNFEGGQNVLIENAPNH